MTLQPLEPSNARDLIASALDWWRSAGVDHAFVDDPHSWLAENAAPAPGGGPIARPVRLSPASESAPAITAPVNLGGDPGAWPQTLPDFAHWWLTESTLDPSPTQRRVPPMGTASAELMVLVPMPEEEDEAILLSGRAGKLLDAMLAAMNLSRDRIYLAAALPARAPAPDWSELERLGLRDVLLHHIALASPKRLLILGRSVVSTLAGHDPAKNGHNFSAIPAGEQSLPVMAGYDLEAMLARPALKAGIWKKWLEWTANDSAGNLAD